MTLHLGDCLEVLKNLPDESVDSLVTDPPAGISFMGKDWDGDKGGRAGWVAWMSEVMRECLRVMKPGAHGLVWAIPRTSHWTATALEDAGFEVRDVITHLFGQGFPKSLDISKAIDKAAGAKGETYIDHAFLRRNPPNAHKDDYRETSGSPSWKDGISGALRFKPATDAAKKWSGWGTALKPASEHWILVRKPVSEKNVSANVLKWGTGGINVDGCRIAYQGDYRSPARANGEVNSGGSFGTGIKTFSDAAAESKGRFPANLVLSHSPHCTDDQCDIECAIKALDEQSGVSKSIVYDNRGRKTTNFSIQGKPSGRSDVGGYSDSGGASRFFYCAKISPSERGEDNNHPTVKPQKLMRYLCRLITPPAGTVLDPFMGSGSTGMAAKSEGFQFVGIERDGDYFEIAKARLRT